MHALEMHPLRVRRVYQAAVGEVVGGQQVTELVVDSRCGDRRQRQQNRANRHRDDADQQDGETSPAGDPAQTHLEC